jgi:hypothetical protein
VGIAQRGRAGLLARELRHPRTIATYRPLRFGSLQRKADLVSPSATRLLKASGSDRTRNRRTKRHRLRPAVHSECTSSWRGHAQVQGIRVRARNVARHRLFGLNRQSPNRAEPREDTSMVGNRVIGLQRSTGNRKPAKSGAPATRNRDRIHPLEITPYPWRISTSAQPHMRYARYRDGHNSTTACRRPQNRPPQRAIHRSGYAKPI